jgi:hypothetical protein
MTSLFDNGLTELEREVRDLKTAHNIPPGSLDFYRKSRTVTTSSGLIQPVYVRVTNKTGEQAFSFQQVYFTRVGGAENYDWNAEIAYAQDGMIAQYYYPLKGGTTYEFTVINTADFDLIVKNYEDSDWIE